MSWRAPLRRCHVLLHRLAIVAARLVLRLRPSPRTSSPPARPEVFFLLMWPWGVGGTIRTTLNLAGYLTRTHEVDVIGVIRGREQPFFEIPSGVTLTTVDDRRQDPADGRRHPIRGLLRALPSLLLHPRDRASRRCTLWTDLMLL